MPPKHMFEMQMPKYECVSLLLFYLQKTSVVHRHRWNNLTVLHKRRICIGHSGVVYVDRIVGHIKCELCSRKESSFSLIFGSINSSIIMSYGFGSMLKSQALQISNQFQRSFHYRNRISVCMFCILS